MSKKIMCILSIIFLLYLGIFVFNDKGYSENDKINLVLRYLEQKYNEDFVVESFLGGGWAYSYDTIICYPKAGTEADAFKVRGAEQNNRTYLMRDGYFEIIIRDEYNEFMTSIINDVFPDFQLDLIFKKGIYADKLNKNTSIKEIYDISNSFSTYSLIFIKQSIATDIDLNDACKEILQKMADNKIVGNVTLYVIKDERYNRANIEPLNINEWEKIVDDIIYESKEFYVRDDLSIEIN